MIKCFKGGPLRRPVAWLLSVVLLLGLVPLSVAAASTGEAAKLTVHFLDVGQADSIVIQLPNGQTMLIDGGNEADGKTIAAYLKSQDIKTIDYLVATHPHADHIGGLPTVIGEFGVGQVYMPKATHTSQTYEKLLTAIVRKGLTAKAAKAGVSIVSANGMNAEFVAPVQDSYSSLNDYSAVVKLTYGDDTFLFMGDAEALSESHITADVTADVLKVGHHGSNTSTSNEFLNRVSPKYAVVSVGKDNSYGHPSDTVVRALNDAKVNVYRTDTDGTVIMTSDGKGISITKAPSSYQSNAPPTAKAPGSGGSSSGSGQSGNGQAVQPEESQSAAVTSSATVYVTKTGAKYHSSGCQYLSKSKISISLEDAKRSYEPCSKCSPPR